VKEKKKIRVESCVAYVPLTKGYEAVIDIDDLDIVSNHNWYALVLPKVVYAARTETRNGKTYCILMHRAILCAKDGFLVDHSDCNGLNNRRNNLRLATRQQNQCNQRISASNTSGFKGVTWCKSDLRWKAQIGHKGKNYFLGNYKTPEMAYEAYVKASAELHGEFGRVN